MNAIAIVGIGGIFPGADNPHVFWENILKRVSAAREVPEARWQLPLEKAYDPIKGALDKVYSRHGCFIQGFSQALLSRNLSMDPSLLETLDPMFHLLLYAGCQAFEDAVTKNLDRARVGVIIGNIVLPTEKASAMALDFLGRTFEEKLLGKHNDKTDRRTNPLNRYVAGLPAGVLAKALGLGNGSFTLDAACASSLYALKFAADELISGRADAMLTGGLSRPDCLYTQMGFSQLRALSPSGICSPFDRNADGLVVGEGAGILVLKRTADAIKDGDHIYGVISGIGLSNDVGGSLLAPDSEGQLRAMRPAYEEAGWSPQDVDLMECHATGTPVGDAVEFESLKSLWGTRGWSMGQCPIGSVKSNIGHLLTAAGSAALIKVLLAIKNKTLPPSANFRSPHPNFGMDQSPFRVLTKPVAWTKRNNDAPRRAAVNAFGFGGVNAHVLIEEWTEPQPIKSETQHSKSKILNLKSKIQNPKCEIAIIGMDAYFGQWNNLDKFRERVLGKADKTGPKSVHNWWGSEQSSWYKDQGLDRFPFSGHFIDHLPVSLEKFRIPPRELEEMLPQQSLMLQVAGRAILNAGLTEADRMRTGVLIGLGLDLNTTNFNLRWWIPEKAKGWAKKLGLDLADEELDKWIQVLQDAVGPPLNANRTMGALGAIVASRIAREFHMGGPSLTISSEESSGIRALETAVHLLEYGTIDHAVVGAVDMAGDIRSVLGTHFGRPFSASGKIRPFAPDADGTIIGEGAAAVILKRLDQAVHDKNRIYAVIKGIGAATGGGIEPAVPDVKTCRTAMERAYEYTGINPGTVTYIETHGSGCPDEDNMELQALKAVFSSRQKEAPYPLGSVKAHIGHTGAASGMASLVKLCLCLHQEIPASTSQAGHHPPSGTMDRNFFIPFKPQYRSRNHEKGLRRAALNCFSMDGNCTHVILEAFERQGKPIRRADIRQPLGAGGSAAEFRVETAPATIIVPVGGKSFHIPVPGSGETEKRKNGRHKDRQSKIPQGPHQAVRPYSPERGEAGAGGRSRESQNDHLKSKIALARSMLPILRQMEVAEEAGRQAHEQYLRLSQDISQTLSRNLAFQMSLMETLKCQAEYRPDKKGESSIAFDRNMCLEFAVGSITRMLGPDFAVIDSHPTRVRLPDEPLMLVDRILWVEGQPGSLTTGKVTTEHDILPGAWYLDNGRIPTCIAVEAGQADLFLSAYLGIDFHTKGLAVYRLLDASVTFHRELPEPGSVLRFEIEIERFFRQGETFLFRFNFKGMVNGQPLLTMTDGCAGFFTSQELAAGQGIVHTELDMRPLPGQRPDDWQDFVPMSVASYNAAQINALRSGDLAGCFGPLFEGLELINPLCIPGGRMSLVDRVVHLDPRGGRFGLGFIRAETDIHPDDWFLTCHFVDDRVMPGTLMYECCLHTLRIFLLRMGWVGEQDSLFCSPVPGIAGCLKCRGQVTETTRIAAYEVNIRELGYRPEPYAIVDSLMYADEKPIVEITDMSIRFCGLTKEKLTGIWQRKPAFASKDPVAKIKTPRSKIQNPKPEILFNHDRILEFAVGKPSKAFGKPYKIFDSERFIARFPGPPYQFLDRITEIDAEQWHMKAGGMIETQYDVPADAWYFSACGMPEMPEMPFAVLLEVALQSCGWFAAYMGSALTSENDLRFRNLGGKSTQYESVFPDAGTLTTSVKITNVSASAGMIIQNYDFEVQNEARLVYKGDTYFGFFTRNALADQVGIRDAGPYEPTPEEIARALKIDYPTGRLFPDTRLRMIDRVDLFAPDGGPNGLGFILGTKRIDPRDWFFKAHFFQDPVWPGTLGLESFLQLIKVMAVNRWGLGGWNERPDSRHAGPGIKNFTMVPGEKHHWLYRGQVIPSDKLVTVQASARSIDDDHRRIKADGFLTVDGRVIYQINDFAIMAR